MPRPASAARRGISLGRLGASRTDLLQHGSRSPIAHSGGGVYDGACESVLLRPEWPKQLPPLSPHGRPRKREAQLPQPRLPLHLRAVRERPPRHSAYRLCAYGASWKTSSSGV